MVFALKGYRCTEVSKLNMQPNSGYYGRTSVPVIAGIVDVTEDRVPQKPQS
jgi:hypothetical protein